MKIKPNDLSTTHEGPVFLGIDPGLNGGIAWIHGPVHRSVVMPDTEADMDELLDSLVYRTKHILDQYIFAMIEQQIPRPTRWFSGGSWQSSILKSTCLLYANYMQCRAFLTALEVPWEDCPPKRWQKGLGIPERGDADEREWKNRLKATAQRMFPDVRMTLKNCDALLIAEHCRRTHK